MWELLVLVDLADDGADLAHPQFEHVNFFVEDAKYGVLDRAGGDKVEDEHLAGHGLVHGSMRPMRCSMAIGFHGMSKLISVLQN